jgi:hypoxanthine phosphoribosyltransferase
MTMRDDMESVLLSEEQIAARIRELGAQLSRDYEGKDPVFVGVLKGCFVFMADLMRSVDIQCTMDFMAVSSYGSGTTTTGAVKINKDLSQDIAGRHVIIVEDILDSGVTLSYLTKYLSGREPASIRIVTLLDKPARRRADIKADYAGFEVPDAFVVGYGLDYDEAYRNVPFIGILKPEIYTK